MSTFPQPLIAWGTADDISGASYTSSGTISTTGGQADPFGGTSAYLLDDNDAGVQASRYKSWVNATSATPPVVVFAKAGTATASAIELYDVTAAQSRYYINIAWSGGVAAAAASTGTLAGCVDVGGGWYAVLGYPSVTVVGNTNRLYLFPDSSANSGTGTCVFYVRHAVLPYYPDNSAAYSQPREGSAWVQGASGTEDAWIVGTDEYLAFDARWIDANPRSSSVLGIPISGWDGQAESAGIGDGMKALLEAGRSKSALTFARDRSAASTNQTAYLVDPMGNAPDLEPDASRRVRLTLRSSSPFPGY